MSPLVEGRCDEDPSWPCRARLLLVASLCLRSPGVRISRVVSSSRIKTATCFHGQVTLEMTSNHFLTSLRRVSVELRFGASQGCGWLRMLADSLISIMQQAILAQPYHMRMRSVLDGCVQPRTPPTTRAHQALSSSL